MLSKEIYQSWNLKDPNDPHLKELMDRVGPAAFTTKTSTDSQFRRSVVDRLHKRRLDELKDIANSDLLTDETKCCGWRGSVKRNSAETEVVWRRMECKTMESFEAITHASVSSSLNCIKSLRTIIQSLSYWEDPHPDWEGLSVIGGYMWLLAFAVQHLMDENNPKGPMLPGVAEIRSKYQEIAQAGEVFSEMMENFHKHTCRVRTDALLMVKKMVRKWKLEATNPLHQRPEQSPNVIRPPKRRYIGPAGLAELMDEQELCKENMFTLNWSPMTILLRSAEIDWTVYGSLNPPERVHWFGQFIQKTLDILELAAEDLTLVTGQISTINIEGFVDEPTSHARELSGALLSFANSTPAPKKVLPEEAAKMTQLLSDYWFSIDILHEEGHKLFRLVHETRDIIRTCYVYTDVFYKWHLPSYDAFLPQTNKTKGKRKGASQTMSNIREVWDKFMRHDGSESRKLSDVSEILIMMDFSTSAYQAILEHRPITCDGGMSIKLEPRMTLEDDFFDIPQVTGLISGTDKRKSSRAT